MPVFLSHFGQTLFSSNCQCLIVVNVFNGLVISLIVQIYPPESIQRMISFERWYLLPETEKYAAEIKKRRGKGKLNLRTVTILEDQFSQRLKLVNFADQLKSVLPKYFWVIQFREFVKMKILGKLVTNTKQCIQSTGVNDSFFERNLEIVEDLFKSDYLISSVMKAT